MSDWAGETPHFLIFEPEDGEAGNVGIDVDENGWIEAHRGDFRRPGLWLLVDKEGGAARMGLVTHEGDQFFYTRHHVGVIGIDASELATAVIGRKQPDGTVTRLSLLPTGLVLAGEEHDVDPVTARLL